MSECVDSVKVGSLFNETKSTYMGYQDNQAMFYCSKLFGINKL